MTQILVFLTLLWVLCPLFSSDAQASLSCQQLLSNSQRSEDVKDFNLFPANWRPSAVAGAPAIQKNSSGKLSLIQGREEGQSLLRLTSLVDNQTRLEIQGEPVIFSQFIKWRKQEVLLVNYIPKMEQTAVVELYSLDGNRIEIVNVPVLDPRMKRAGPVISDVQVHPDTDDLLLSLPGHPIFRMLSQQRRGEFLGNNQPFYSDTFSQSPMRDFAVKAFKENEHRGVELVEFFNGDRSVFKWDPSNSGGLKNYDVVGQRDFLPQIDFHWDNLGEKAFVIEKHSGEFVIFDYKTNRVLFQRGPFVDLATIRPKIPTIMGGKFIDTNHVALIRQTDRAYPNTPPNEPPPPTPRKLEYNLSIHSMGDDSADFRGSKVLIDYNFQPHQALKDIHWLEKDQLVVVAIGDAIIVFDLKTGQASLKSQPNSTMNREEKQKYRFLFSERLIGSRIGTFNLAHGYQIWDF